MNNKTTKGPWYVTRDEEGSRIMAGYPLNTFTVAIGKSTVENAQLIAAAPELLSAARNALNVLAALAIGDLKAIKADSAAIAELRAAILRAEQGAQGDR